MRSSGPAAQRRAATSLARSTPDELTAAWAAFARLVATARAALETPGLCPVPPALSSLAARLADLPVVAGAAVGPAADLETALADALDAVRVCRQVVHAHGGCWFTLEDGHDLCVQVLHAGHASAHGTEPTRSDLA